MNSETNDPNYPLSFEFETTQIKLGVHTENAIHEPRIRWRAEDGEVAGRWGTLKMPQDQARSVLTPYMTIEVAEPHLLFGRNEKAQPTILDISRESITLPDVIGNELHAQLEHLGLVTDDDTVSDDPSSFPRVIRDAADHKGSEKWERIGWEAERNAMWYTHCGSDDQPRIYQIKDGTLVWCKNEWPSISADQDIIAERGLKAFR